MNRQHFKIVLLLMALLVPTAGCSIRRVAVNKIGNALAGSGSTFASDDDPDLIKAAAPFSLKLMESLLEQSPRHEGLLLATASGFTQYGYAFVQEEADELEDKDLNAATALRTRARRLYLRARNYGLRGLAVKHKGFQQKLASNPKAATATMGKDEVPLLYWTAVSWAGAISLSKDNPDLIADIPKVEALIDRALELNESFDHGAIHNFLITYEMSRRGGKEDPATLARKHFQRAVELSGGQMAAPFVSLAESVSVQRQDQKEFKEMLDRALAIDADTRPEWRLANLIMQRRARWLLARTDDLFLGPAEQPKEAQ